MSATELEDEMFSILKQQVLQSEDGAGIAALNAAKAAEVEDAALPIIE